MTSVFDVEETKTDAQLADERKNLALQFAQNYVAVFVHAPQGATLLKHWTETYAKKRTPVNAPHTEYAANEAVRAFIEGIHDQIRRAQDPMMR